MRWRESERPPTESVDRVPGPDVVRALALIGVVVMNYHGYLIIRGASPSPGWWTDVFDPFAGPLLTRFASTFVLTAGVGITLLTRRVVADRAAGVEGADAAVLAMRWRLVRRGLLLYVLGQVLEVIWNGTIIVYYGAMFVVAAVLFTLASRWVAVVGIVCALAGWAINTWVFWQREDGQDVSWLLQPGTDTVRRFVFDLAVNGTHPLLPWMAFLCAGIILGRHLDDPTWRPLVAGLGVMLFASGVLASTLASTPFTEELLSTSPRDRGLAYVASVLGTALIAFAAISFLADRATGLGADLVDPLRRAGQMTLTLYVAHILVFNLVVDWLGVVEPAGLGTALLFSAVFWIAAIAAGTAWHRRVGRGPLERIYRSFGG